MQPTSEVAPPADPDELDAAAAQVLGVSAEKLREQRGPSADRLEEFAAAHGLEVAPPARPELLPGESVTTVPDRYCEQCAQPRGGRRCQVCRGLTVRIAEIEEAEEYEPERFTRRAARRREPSLPAAELERDELEEEPRAVAGGNMFLGRPRGAPARGRPMQQRFRAREEEDDRVVHISPSRKRAGARKRSAEDILSDMWVMQTINLQAWWAAYGALIQAHKPQSPEELAQLADLADAAYIEMMARQQSG